MINLDKMERTIGATGLSIGTHLMCESIFEDLEKYDKDRETPSKVNLNDYKIHFFNLYTLVRNVINSFQELDKEKIMSSKDLINKILDELFLLEAMYTLDCKIVFYFCNYEKAIKAFNKDKDLEHYSRYERHLFFTNYLKDLIKKNTVLKDKLLLTDHKLPTVKGKALITTHFAIDLCNRIELDLLETHSGRLKKKTEFNTKYHDVGKMDLTSIPFMPELLYILGDDTLVKITNLVTRREIATISIMNNWTVLTSHSKVMSNIKNIEGVNSLLSKFKNPY